MASSTLKGIELSKSVTETDALREELSALRAEMESVKDAEATAAAKMDRDRKNLERERRDFEAERERLVTSCREVEAKALASVRECEAAVKEKVDELDRGRKKLESERVKLTRDLREREAAVEELKDQLEKEKKITRDQRKTLKQDLEAAAEERDKAAQEWLECEKERLAERERTIQEAEGRFQRSFVMTGGEGDTLSKDGPSRDDAEDLLLVNESRIWGGESRVPALATIFPDVSALPAPAVEELPYHASDLTAWTIDPFAVAREIQSPLQSMALDCVAQWNLTDRISVEPFKRFVAAVEAAYLKNPYHNAIHAADVLQSTFALVSHCPSLMAEMPVSEKIGVLVSAICHDVCHPGRSNAFLAATHDPIAIRFGNQSILEHHSIAVTFDIMKHRRCDFASTLGAEGFTQFRDFVCALILDTDMAKTVPHLHDLETSIRSYKELCHRAAATKSTAPPSFYASAANRRKVLGTLLHAGDISGSSKPVTIAKKWAAAVLKEMREESDEVVQGGIAGVRTMGDDIPRGQIFFIDTFVAPLFHVVVGDIIEEPMTSVLPVVETTIDEAGRTVCPAHLQDPLRCLANVRALWAKQIGAPVALPPRRPLGPSEASKIEALEEQLAELRESVGRRKADLDKHEQHLQRRLQEVERLEEEGARIREEQRVLADSKLRIADALKQIRAKEEALQRAMEKHHGGQIDKLAGEKRVEHIVHSELRGSEDAAGHIPTEREVELRRGERIVAERERRAREAEAELQAKGCDLATKQRDIAAMEAELQDLLGAAKQEQALIKGILEREAAVAKRESELEVLTAHMGHFATREAAAHELEERLLTRAYESNVRARASRMHLVAAQHVRDEVIKKWENNDKYLQHDAAIGTAIEAMRAGREAYIKGNLARRQEKDAAAAALSKSRPRAVKLPSSPTSDAAEEQPAEPAPLVAAGQTMPLPAPAAGFHIDGELDELEHKLYALTHCISMLAVN